MGREGHGRARDERVVLDQGLGRFAETGVAPSPDTGMPAASPVTARGSARDPKVLGGRGGMLANMATGKGVG
ncbi:hypothetical protein AUC70_14100 [Methyloceanibacter stevinii]|uniref:Uncharacterized protein n=1 Tax=Methyloceanibacter stevinii TaxID=1774970 RepID=A0A1E3VTR9_9HYPH|nr:hypothetical protein [Methyloceanibacter stevinii]ODR96905.1 hypothetical protein AUC70_14100 [Methyloceanibacter stevinii]